MVFIHHEWHIFRIAILMQWTGGYAIEEMGVKTKVWQEYSIIDANDAREFLTKAKRAKLMNITIQPSGDVLIIMGRNMYNIPKARILDPLSVSIKDKRQMLAKILHDIIHWKVKT